MAGVESRAWVQQLSSDGPVRDEALKDLHELLLRAARFEVARRRGAVPHLGVGELDDLTQQSADDALVAVLRKLDDFRGASRFTTWAYKFALLEAAATVRRRSWQGRELPLEPELWALIADDDLTAHQKARDDRSCSGTPTAIRHDLTAHQREVLVAVTLNDVPIDVLAERRNTTRERSTRPCTTRGASSDRGSSRGFGSGAYAETAAA